MEEQINKQFEYLEKLVVTEHWSTDSFIYAWKRMESLQRDIEKLHSFAYNKINHITTIWANRLLAWSERLVLLKDKFNMA
jgi:hypothetical protein